MKTLKYIMSFALGLSVLGCDPIEDRDVLTNSYNPDNIELIATQSTPGGNLVTLRMNTPGVAGYWDYKLDKAFGEEVTFVCPFVGDVEFSYHVASEYIPDGNLSARESIIKTVVVNVQTQDHPVPETLTNIAGTDTEGKAWVFSRSEPLWWFMSSGGPEAKDPWGMWWNAAECCAPSDQGGKMVFDLNGAANYTYYPDKDGEPAGKGSFSFNSSFTKLYITGGLNILGAEGTVDVNGCARSLSTFAEFEVVELTSEKLVLYIADAECDSGWTWVFVPEE